MADPEAGGEHGDSDDDRAKPCAGDRQQGEKQQRYEEGGPEVTKGKEEREFDGSRYIMERGIVADLSIVHAWMADTEGNLVYRKTARNFNPMMATAGKVTVAEVEHLVQPGDLNPDHIITPGVYVKRIVHVPDAVKHIEQRTVRKRVAAAGTGEEV